MRRGSGNPLAGKVEEKTDFWKIRGKGQYWTRNTDLNKLLKVTIIMQYKPLDSGF